MGRPMIPITATQIRMVTESYSKDPAGVVRIAKRLRHDTYRAVYRIMKKNGTAGSSPAKSEWVRYADLLGARFHAAARLITCKVRVGTL